MHFSISAILLLLFLATAYGNDSSNVTTEQEVEASSIESVETLSEEKARVIKLPSEIISIPNIPILESSDKNAEPIVAVGGSARDGKIPAVHRDIPESPDPQK